MKKYPNIFMGIILKKKSVILLEQMWYISINISKLASLEKKNQMNFSVCAEITENIWGNSPKFSRHLIFHITPTNCETET